MWRHVLPPVVLVATLWLGMSGATTFYMSWVEQSFQRVFVENISSIRAADALQTAVWRMAAQSPHQLRRAGSDDALRELDREVKKLRESASAPAELPVLARIEELLEDFRRQLAAAAAGVESIAVAEAWSLRTSELAKQISTAAEDLKEINEGLIAQATASRERLHRGVFFLRMALLMAGPGLGIYFGMRLARRLQSSVTRLSVTLRDAATDRNLSLGEVMLEPRGSLPGIQAQARDVVDRVRQVTDELQSARLEIIRSERLAAVGELAAGVAHELRNPLTSVKLLLQHAARQNHNSTANASTPSHSPLNPDKLRLILDEISRMESTIQALLDFARPRELDRVPHDLRETLQRGLNLVEGRARQQRVEIDSDFGDTPLPIEGDPEQLNQIFVNLLLNGIEAMEQGGRLSVDAAQDPERRLIRIRFRDSGPGITADLLPRLFEPFATTKERGTGLGLAVSRRIAEDHGGMIRAENLPEGGALFTVELPAEQSDSALRESNPGAMAAEETLRVESGV